MNEKYAEMIQCRRTALGASLLFQSSAVLVITLVAATQIGCADGQQQGPSLELRSNSFEGDAIPNTYSSCKGQDDISPQLSLATDGNGINSVHKAVIVDFIHLVRAEMLFVLAELNRKQCATRNSGDLK